ncbi:MAG TPA: metallophosphoesterase [Candidatus Babeliales bacterium]|nr:metallophosphoesterase [Candidatus Babeliales bacterium]
MKKQLLYATALGLSIVFPWSSFTASTQMPQPIMMNKNSITARMLLNDINNFAAQKQIPSLSQSIQLFITRLSFEANHGLLSQQEVDQLRTNAFNAVKNIKEAKLLATQLYEKTKHIQSMPLPTLPRAIAAPSANSEEIKNSYVNALIKQLFERSMMKQNPSLSTTFESALQIIKDAPKKSWERTKATYQYQDIKKRLTTLMRALSVGDMKEVNTQINKLPAFLRKPNAALFSFQDYLSKSYKNQSYQNILQTLVREANLFTTTSIATMNEVITQANKELLPPPNLIETPADNETRIHVIADIEGTIQKVKTFAEKSDILVLNPNDPTDYKATLRGNNTQLIFLGDSIDKGPNSKWVLQFLIHLKRTYPNQVTLIMGNRDINKLRFFGLKELTDAALKMDEDTTKFWPNRFRLSGWEPAFKNWLNKKVTTADGKEMQLASIDGVPTEYTHGKNPQTDKILKLKFLMQETLGAGMLIKDDKIVSDQNAFDDFKKEINAATDKQAYDAYIAFVSPGGLVAQYLQLAELIHWDKATGTLFMHGGIAEKNFGYVPETAKGRNDAKTIANTDEWIPALNRWGQDRIKDALKGNIDGALPIVEYQEPTIIINKDGLQIWDPTTPNPYSVVQVRPFGPDRNLAPMSNKLIAQLLKDAINKLIVGHSPVGEVPVIIKNEDGTFISVVADTSYAAAPHPRNGVIEVTKGGVKVYADYYENKGTIKNELIYSSQDPRIGTAEMLNGKKYWNISTIHDGKDMLQGTWAAPAVTYQIVPIAPVK